MSTAWPPAGWPDGKVVRLLRAAPVEDDLPLADQIAK